MEREKRTRLAAWVAREILPAEPRIRAWLRRNRAAAEDVDEVIQEAYCRLAALGTVDHIDVPEAYFFSLCRNLFIRRIRRERVVSITMLAEIEASSADPQPSPERAAIAQIDYARMLELMDRLPERCRTIVRLRKVEGWSQRRIAEHLATTEKAVEKQIWAGVRAIRAAWNDAEADGERRFALPPQQTGGQP